MGLADHEHDKIDSFRLHGAVQKRHMPVVVRESQGEFDIRHFRLRRVAKLKGSGLYSGRLLSGNRSAKEGGHSYESASAGARQLVRSLYFRGPRSMGKR